MKKIYEEGEIREYTKNIRNTREGEKDCLDSNEIGRNKIHNYSYISTIHSLKVF